MPWGSGLCLWSAGITGHDLPGFYVGLGDQNWGPHVYVINTLPHLLSVLMVFLGTLKLSGGLKHKELKPQMWGRKLCLVLL